MPRNYFDKEIAEIKAIHERACAEAEAVLARAEQKLRKRMPGVTEVVQGNGSTTVEHRVHGTYGTWNTHETPRTVTQFLELVEDTTTMFGCAVCLP